MEKQEITTEIPSDLKTDKLRELLCNLYSAEDHRVKTNARSSLHNFFVYNFKLHSKLHKNVDNYGYTPDGLWAQSGHKWAFGANWARYKDSIPVVLFTLPNPPNKKPAVSVSFRCYCCQGTNKYVDYLWKKALPGNQQLKRLYPNIQFIDRGKSIKHAKLVYDSLTTRNITVQDINDLIKTLACFFDTIDPYLS